MTGNSPVQTETASTSLESTNRSYEVGRHSPSLYILQAFQTEGEKKIQLCKKRKEMVFKVAGIYMSCCAYLYIVRCEEHSTRQILGELRSPVRCVLAASLALTPRHDNSLISFYFLYFVYIRISWLRAFLV